MGIIDLAQKEFEPIIVDLKLIASDGKPAALKCRPLVLLDFYSIQMKNGKSTVPILTGQKSPDDMTEADKLALYAWFRELVRISAFAIRDNDDAGNEIWRQLVFEPETLEKPFYGKDGSAHFSLRWLEQINGGDIANVANAIIERANTSRELEAAKRGS